MGRRPGRAAANKAAAKLKNTPQTFEDPEDETMADPTSDAAPSDDNDDNDDGDAMERNDTPIDQDSAQPSEANSPEPEPEPIIRKKRLGRPPKIKPPGWDEGIEVTTPRRGRGRGGGFGRGRGGYGRRGGPSHVTQQPIDKEGNLVDVVDDEVALPEDEEGEKKVDKLGNLQGDRDYRCRTFTVLNRDGRLYMLSTEPARCVGFRDSYLFFAKHKKLYKIIINDEEKRDLIEREIIPHSYKGRAIGIVTARSVFREFGAQIIIGGRRIIDDYEVKKLREEGAVEGEIADPTDVLPKPGEPYNKNQYVAWHGASSVYHSGAPTVPLAAGKTAAQMKRKVAVNDMNWQLEHALEASRFNSSLAAKRRANLAGVYDPHTNQMQYPRTMQSTHARWEPVDHAMDVATSSMQKLTTSAEAMEHADSTSSATIFPPVKPEISSRYLIADTVLENPRFSGLGIPGPDGALMDTGFNGVSSIPQHLKDELPVECREALEEAIAKEQEWKKSWGDEKTNAMRRPPIIDKGYIM